MDITYNLTIKTLPKTVYNAVSSENGIKGWWSKECTVGSAKGEKSLLKFNKQGTIVEMGFKTISLDTNKKVIWECIENANLAWLGTQIITEIEEIDGTSKVKFSHEGFDEKWKGNDAFEMTKGGWDHFMKSLIDFCENGKGQPW